MKPNLRLKAGFVRRPDHNGMAAAAERHFRIPGGIDIDKNFLFRGASI
jgi:hypothetical protein